MKFSLTVLSAGAMQGKSIPVAQSQFLIGRGRECNLRPSNPIISKRHCALITRDNQVFVRDFASTNGTYVNDAEVKDEVELKDGDCLNLGPLAFRVTIEQVEKVSGEGLVSKVQGSAVGGQESGIRSQESEIGNQDTPRVLPSPPLLTTAHHSAEDEAAAELLLAMHDDAGSTTTSEGDQKEAPSVNGSTIVENSQNLETAQQTPLQSGAADRHDAAQAAAADTSAAAKVILDKYIRRPRA